MAVRTARGRPPDRNPNLYQRTPTRTRLKLQEVREIFQDLELGKIAQEIDSAAESMLLKETADSEDDH